MTPARFIVRLALSYALALLLMQALINTSHTLLDLKVGECQWLEWACVFVAGFFGPYFAITLVPAQPKA